MGSTTRSDPLIRKRIPIIASNNPNKIIKVEKSIIDIVFSKRFWTSGVAGLRLNIFNAPNQKKTIKRPNLAVGSEIFLNR